MRAWWSSNAFLSVMLEPGARSVRGSTPLRILPSDWIAASRACRTDSVLARSPLSAARSFPGAQCPTVSRCCLPPILRCTMNEMRRLPMMTPNPVSFVSQCFVRSTPAGQAIALEPLLRDVYRRPSAIRFVHHLFTRSLRLVVNRIRSIRRLSRETLGSVLPANYLYDLYAEICKPRVWGSIPQSSTYLRGFQIRCSPVVHRDG
jgi:hypothetical protein